MVRRTFQVSPADYQAQTSKHTIIKYSCFTPEILEFVKIVIKFRRYTKLVVSIFYRDGKSVAFFVDTVENNHGPYIIKSSALIVKIKSVTVLYNTQSIKV